MTRRMLLLLLCLLAASASSPARAQTTVVVLVRHAEKGTTPADDPPLTAAGIARAQALAAALANTNVQAVITTELTRTKETARPLVEARGITPQVVHSGPRDAHAKAVADAVRAHEGQTVLVVGHSNTVPAIIAALGGPKLPDICDSQYSNLFVLIIGPAGRKPDLIVSSFGAPSPDPAASCANSMK